MRIVYLSLLLTALSPSLLIAQSDVAARPIVGLRDDRSAQYALVNATVVVEPGQVIDGATVLVQDTTITAVGQNLTIPSGYQSIDCQGKRIYAGLVDAWSEVEVPVEETTSGYWNQNVTPQRRAALSALSLPDAAKLRSQGISTRVVSPAGGIVQGKSCVVLLDEESAGRALLAEEAWQNLQLTVPRRGSREVYPNSPMGATALLRQAMHDARWYRDAWDAYRANPELPRPETNLALQELSEAILEDTFVIDVPNERMALRADQVAQEFSLKTILRGSGREYRDLTAIVALNRPILIPVNFPETPNVKSIQALERVTLQDLMHWDLAPENPGRLSKAGARICLTTDGLKDVGDFLKQVRKAVERGLERDAALAAMTTVPAELLDISDHVGRVQVGKLANLAITDGDLFDEKTKVLECWVAGRRFQISEPPNHELTDKLVGSWIINFQHTEKPVSLQLLLSETDDKLNGSLKQRPLPDDQTASTASSDAPSDAIANDANAQSPPQGDVPPSNEQEKQQEEHKKADEPKKESEEQSTKLTDLVRERDRIVASVNLHDVDPSLTEGVSLLTLVLVSADATSELPRVFATIRLPSGITTPMELVRDESASTQATESESNESKPSDEEIRAEKPAVEPSSKTVDAEVKTEAEVTGAESSEEAGKAITDVAVATPILSPLGAYGLESLLGEQPFVLFRGATIWTCDETGVIEAGDVLIRDGVIVAVDKQLQIPDGCQVIDVQGKHITPGLIDCHSHMATDGGVNESGQAITAEVRISDFLDNSDINIYRQLAGGLTTANILHGSANPIGGQNQVIKLRWGESMDGLRMKEAPPGIKFALGENVKRESDRYPNTRMGVEQILRDQLLAAREYQTTWRRWRSGERGMLPPRVDLQLEALAEVQQGRRWVHCHSYRQDEIVATLDVLEEFGIQIGTLQHILEGYKVADRMAQHGAMGSSFSDWWAYKIEVFDAIPYNGALMHDLGVVVSFNSDDRELARHMNTEAAKATKYGGVAAEEALKFVTLNPARQLRIDTHVGSLTPGKHADLVIWSGRPLSTLSRCEQTWIDGRRYFDLASDQQMQQRDAQLKARLVQKALGAEPGKSPGEEKPVAEEDRWVRIDVFCTAHGGSRNRNTNSGASQ